MRDFLQGLQINENKQRASHASSRAHSNKVDIHSLNDKVEALNLLVSASLELLGELGISEARILKKIEEIDLRDGVQDGKLAPSRTCGDCGRKVNNKRTNCFYCGARVSFNRASD